MLTSAERRVALALVLWLAAGAALDAILAHRPRALAPWLGPARVADVARAGSGDDDPEPLAVAAIDSVLGRPRRTKPPARARRSLAYDERGRLDLNRAD